MIFLCNESVLNLTLDVDLTPQLASLPRTSNLSLLLAKGRLQWFNRPLEAHTCERFGVLAVPDYPVAALAAAADGLSVTKGYWLRADPVHLMMQRDSMSLIEPIPQAMQPSEAQALMHTLNQHFAGDGLNFVLGKSGAWYVCLAQAPQLSTTLPRVALGKNVYTFMPQGVEASRWLAIMNEVQMLWFEHPVNVARVAAGQYEVNSVWFSGGGEWPNALPTLHTPPDLMLSNNVLHQGLAHRFNITHQAQPSHMNELLQTTKNKIQLALMPDAQLDEQWFKPLVAAIQQRKIKQLTLNIGFYEKTLAVTVKPIDLMRFWRKPCTVESVFNG